MTTATIPGPLWFRLAVGGIMFFSATAVLAGVLIMSPSPDSGFTLLVQVLTLALFVVGLALALSGLWLRARSEPDNSKEKGP